MCSWVHAVISIEEQRLMLLQCCPRAQRSEKILIFSLVPFTQIFILIFRILRWLCTADDIYSLHNFLLRNIIVPLFVHVVYLQFNEPLPIFTSHNLCLSKTFFLYHVTDRLPINLISSSICFFIAQLTFPAFSSPVPALFGLLASNSKWANKHIFYEIVKFLTLNIWYVFYVLL